LIGGQPVLYRLGRRNDDDRVSLHDGLAGEGVPGLDVGRRETHDAAAPHRSRLDDDRAPAAAPLAAARLSDLDAGGTSGFDQERSGRNPHGLGIGVEPDDVVGGAATGCSSSRYVSTAFM
jgi:hypothetical protein